ncbi:MAG: trypsin-like peptidase domain-containing protein [Chloroflexi bacterium]|nr:trypsin-like peptidase domain-containing protein [Chloroflexota bacterium]
MNEEPGSRDRRAIDGLDWGLPPPVEGHERPAPLPPRLVPGPEEPRPRAQTPVAPGMLRYGIVAGGAALLGGLVAAFAVAAVDGDGGGGATAGQTATAPQPLTVQQTSAIADVAAKARPGVIKIESTRRNGSTVEQDVGSGVVIDTQGHVITNAHVVLGTETLRAIMPDGSSRPAILLGHDYPFTDLAVLQIGPGQLSPIEIGDSGALVLGETVIAIGNPLAEFEGSVTVGVVSGLNRKRVYDGVNQDDLIQTDAALNNGNSGGALLNLRGQFIGMPTSVLRQVGSGQPVEGIGFALPSNRVMAVAQGIIAAGGQYPRPSLGLDHVDISPDLMARGQRLATDKGALVTRVAPAGPSSAAGIVSGDIITKVGDQDVGGDALLLNVLESFEPGQTVKVVLNRNGKIIETEVRLAKRS